MQPVLLQENVFFHCNLEDNIWDSKVQEDRFYKYI